MIADFKNPHGGLKPSRIEEVEPNLGYKYRIARIHGAHYIQMSLISEDKWFNAIDEFTGKFYKFQTRHEAEYFMTQLKSTTIYYYYEQ
jgi:hypothetical protein